MAESAVLSRHLRTLWGIPGAELAVVGWPATRRERIFATWDYWWQAHLLDCVIDAANREATPARTRRIAAIAHGHRVRNITGWTNDYYDDMAWLALALERADRTRGLTDLRGGLAALEKEIVEGWQSPAGAMPWRKGADYFNAPANGPVGILLARLGRHARAREVADWLHETLRDPETGLILDGIHLPSGELERPVFTYCQGTVLGLETELAVRTGEFEHVDRVQQLLCAVEEHLTADAVVTGGGGGDGGLFNGILARYLAVVAVMLPGEGAAQVAARRTAARIVTCSARAAWDHRLEVEGEPLFGHDWSRPARMPTGTFGAGYVSVGGSVVASRNPERDLSVQLSGWLLMEAAHLVTAAGF
ncbi:glycoside hydrolase family 76 protein [Nocardia aurantia]|uniref:Fructose-bisphosphate aldolase n=1 Tax=Nocardia aurantia TaxID=2585199 RepID=A0A7K0E0H7_9NOCA|nr:glycoside hydrolase family 76 protein [Nocardia aurantia]MQY31022.1 hypothetical protein [Nocardia aurantia]